MAILKNSRVSRIIPFLLIMTLLCPFANGKVIYVDDDSIGANDGTSWENAYTFLQDALIDANDSEKPVEIRVAQGTYKPNQGLFPIIPAGVGGRTNEPYPAKYPADLGNKASFNLINDVTIKGGYAGLWESDPNVREIELYETILSGDLNGDDIEVNDPCDLFDVPDRYDNSNTVVTGSNIDETAVLDGFTITGGHSMVIPNGGPAGGGGMWIISGSPMLINCTFAENAVHGEGAGLLAQDGSSPTLVNCTLARNAAVTGGGMSNWRNGSPLLVDCRFDGNYARFRGGGMHNYEGDAKLTNCTFSNNSSVGSGAGMASEKSNLVLNSCTFTENTGGSGGGIYSEDNSNLIITNCTFKNNTAKVVFGGGICNEDANELVLTNCIFSGNTAMRDGGGIFNRRTSSTLKNCLFTGNKASGGPANDSSCAGLYAFGDTTLINCTFCGNWAQQGHAIFKYSSSDLRLTNCILWDGGSEIFQKSGVEPDVVYSNIQGGWEGDGNIDADPLFADSGHWASVNDPDIVIEPNHPDAIWIDGDYHLKSQAGRWYPASESWVQDDVTSPCIDAGDPNSPIGYEPFPNGGIINMGSYGGTAQASKSLHGKSIYIFMPDQSMVIQTGGIAGVNWTYTLAGQFQLIIDYGNGKAWFSNVEAIARGHSEPDRTLDPNDVFNLTGLTGTISKAGYIEFTGRTADGSDVLLYLTLSDEWISLKGQTTPPPNSADFFIFDLDAVALRKYGGGIGESNDPYLIYTAEYLNAIGSEPNDWDKHFKLMADIDLSGHSYDAALIAPDADPCDLDFQGASFKGVFDGNGHKISNLTITGEHYLGLFGRLEYGAQIKNLRINNVNIAGTDYVAGIVGFSKGNIETSYCTGTVSGNRFVGGLTGRNWSTINASYNAATVTGHDDVGGLTAGNYGSITNSYNTGAVTADWDAGGLAGTNNGSISKSYSTGTVSGDNRAGGLVGYNNWDYGVITSSFWDTETSGLSTSDGGIGKITAEMQTASTFLEAGWDFMDETANGTEDIWQILEGEDYPRLWWEAAEQ